jgi:hypothetical protein
MRPVSLLGYGHSQRNSPLGDADNAVVAWWVQSTTLHGGPSTNGESPGGGAPYPFTDPDVNLQPDACPPRVDPVT